MGKLARIDSPSIRLLTSAPNDLRRGKRFYDRQQPGIGDYFYESPYGCFVNLFKTGFLDTSCVGMTKQRRICAMWLPWVYDCLRRTSRVPPHLNPLPKERRTHRQRLLKPFVSECLTAFITFPSPWGENPQKRSFAP